MRYEFHIVDVFSSTPFGGNQLAVLPRAEGLSASAMLKIAREFNFAETTFVTSKEEADARRVRIFTPTSEVDFAGHPTVGTACVLVMTAASKTDSQARLVLHENVGPVVVDVAQRDGVFYGTLTLPGAIDAPSEAPSRVDLAAVLSIAEEDVRQVFFAGVGLPFCFAQLRSRAAVDRATLNHEAWRTRLSNAWSANVFLFAGETIQGADLYARMFAPALGIAEDPATGSACAALVGLFASAPEFAGDRYDLSVQQGVAMGRRSTILASATKAAGAVTSISITGAVAYIASGQIEAPR